MAAVPLLQFGWKQAGSKGDILISTSRRSPLRPFTFSQWRLRQNDFLRTMPFAPRPIVFVAIGQRFTKFITPNIIALIDLYDIFARIEFAILAIGHNKRPFTHFYFVNIPAVATIRCRCLSTANWRLCNLRNKPRSFTVLTHKNFLNLLQTMHFLNFDVSISLRPLPLRYSFLSFLFSFNFADGNSIVLIVLTAFSIRVQRTIGIE